MTDSEGARVDLQARAREDEAVAQLMDHHNAQTVCNCDDDAGTTCEFCNATARNFRRVLVALAADEARRAREDEREAHHALGAWPKCPHCTRYYQQDEDGAVENARLSDAMTQAASAVQACITDHSRRCAAELCHDHRMFRDLKLAVKILDDAVARGASQPQPAQPETRGEEWRQRKYARALPIVRAVARKHGYAIGVHGSETRDLDLIAAPWAEEASSAAELAQQIMLAVDGVIVNDEMADQNDYTRRNPQPKPHGRLGWSIQLGGGAYIDLSVLPKTGCAFPGVPGPAKEARVSPADPKGVPFAPNESCPNCGGMWEFTVTNIAHDIPVLDLGSVEVVYPSWKCNLCDFEWYDCVAERIIEDAVQRARVSRSTDSEPEP